jgi:hypothetical protein
VCRRCRQRHLTAAYRSLEGTGAVTVLAASALQGVSMTPASLDLPEGPAACETFQAVGTYADGTSGPVEASWDVDPDPGLDGGVSLVAADPGGTAELFLDSDVTAQTFIVTADAGTQFGSAALTVCAATVEKVTLLPASAKLHWRRRRRRFAMCLPRRRSACALLRPAIAHRRQHHRQLGRRYVARWPRLV